jgi:membrane-associated PAP2 superfamily phosphatase
MNRKGLLVALTLAVIAGGIFATFPQLDLMLAEVFYRGGFGRWVGTQSPWIQLLRKLANWPIILVVAPAIIALVLKLLLPRRPMLMSARASILMISTLLLAPGLMANLILKDNWGRPRPFFVQEFGGPSQFVPWWDPRGSCKSNCSFVAGEPSGAFWTMAAAAVMPAPWRAAAYGAAIVFGAAVGVLRMAAGGHFASDVAFSGIFTFLIIWLVHGLLYRWRRTQVTDAGVERSLERIATPAYDAVARMAARIRGTARGKQDWRR